MVLEEDFFALGDNDALLDISPRYSDDEQYMAIYMRRRHLMEDADYRESQEAYGSDD